MCTLKYCKKTGKWVSLMIPFLSLILSCSKAFSQQPGEYIAKIHESKYDSTRASACITLAEIYFFIKPKLINHVDSGVFYLKQAQVFNKKQPTTKSQNAINIDFSYLDCIKNPKLDPMLRFSPTIDGCKKSGDKFNELKGWRYLQEVLRIDGEQTDSLRLMCDQHAMILSLQLKREDWAMATLKEIGEIHMNQGQFNLAETEFKHIISVGKKGGTTNLLFTYDLLGGLYTKKGEYNKGLLYALKTIDLMHHNGDSSLALNFYSRVAIIYKFLGDYPSAIEWYHKVLDKMEADHINNILFSGVNQMVTCLIAEGKSREALNLILEKRAKYKPANQNEELLLQMDFGKVYAMLGENDLAEKKFHKAEALLKNKFSFNPSFQAEANYAIGTFYLKRAEYSKARHYLINALKCYNERGHVQYVQNTHLALFKIDSAMGNLDSAIYHLQASVRLKDSIFTVAKNRQIEELQISYGTKEKEKDIKLLQNNEKLQQVKLDHERNTRNWIIAGAIMILIIAGLLYGQSTMRKRKNLIITHNNELLQKLLTEKEWLVKEVHHRVKNNLQTIISLLQSQAAYLKNDALKAIETSQNRIYTMSLIHQKLYQSEDIQTIDMAIYIPELIQYLKDSFDNSNNIDFNVKVVQVNLDASIAIPVALIINEALTNSIKYAFPGNVHGAISVSLQEEGESLKLELTDNGIGMKKKSIQENPVSLGLQLIKGLTREIHGEVNFKNDHGVKITLTFKKHALEYASLLEIGTINLA
ncbi:MAG: ATP-binding protein [Bacteroidota bacterium]|nr:ATP-binding protein [Bacteroidota bacterium]